MVTGFVAWFDSFVTVMMDFCCIFLECSSLKVISNVICSQLNFMSMLFDESHLFETLTGLVIRTTDNPNYLSVPQTSAAMSVLATEGQV